MFPNLLAEMARNNISQADICRCLNRQRTCVSNKFNGKIEFRLSEMKTIKDTYFKELSLDYLFEKK